MNVYIITEGGKNIGFGHITRCKSIYQAFRERNINPLFIVNGDQSVTDLIDDTNYKIFNWISEKDELYRLLENSDIAIIDSYLASYGTYKNISNLTRTPVYIDDNNRLEYPSGTVVNGSIYAEELDYPENENINYLLGIKYFPLRKAFWNVPKKKINSEIESIMITFGGDDLRELTPQVIKIARHSVPNVNINVVIGKGFSEKNIVKIKNKENENIRLNYNLSAKDMKNLMIESDIAISGCGQTLYELAATGTPTIGIGIAENQMNNITSWVDKGFIEYAGFWNDQVLEDKLQEKINILSKYKQRNKKYVIGKENISGNNSINIVNCLI